MGSGSRSEDPPVEVEGREAVGWEAPIAVTKMAASLSQVDINV